jgi:hypothetical protein
MRGLFSPPLGHEEQRLIPSADRAGFLSFRSLTFRASFLIIGPTVGMAMDRWNQRPVLLVMGAILVTIAVGVMSHWRRVAFSK